MHHTDIYFHIIFLCMTDKCRNVNIVKISAFTVYGCMSEATTAVTIITEFVLNNGYHMRWFAGSRLYIGDHCSFIYFWKACISE